MDQKHDIVLLSMEKKTQAQQVARQSHYFERKPSEQKHYQEAGLVTSMKILVPKQSVMEVLQGIHGELGKYP